MAHMGKMKELILQFFVWQCSIVGLWDTPWIKDSFMFKHRLFLLTNHADFQGKLLQMLALACKSSRTGRKWSVICFETGLKTNKYKSDLLSSDLLILQPMAQDVVHVLVEALQAAVTRPHIGVVGGQKTLHRGLQAGQQLPVLLPVRKIVQQDGGGGWRRGKFRNEEGGKEMLVLAVTHVNKNTFPVIKNRVFSILVTIT